MTMTIIFAVGMCFGYILALIDPITRWEKKHLKCVEKACINKPTTFAYVEKDNLACCPDHFEELTNFIVSKYGVVK